jgi:hypothetical protein
VQTERQRRSIELAENCLACRVVGVEHRHAVFAQQVEDPLLYRAVIGGRAVATPQVREHRNRQYSRTRRLRRDA